ncbi:hypothetical protein FJY94_00400 [Candidatus Kaiserbacteria bacterium]|nr:hypothetical protein [Candidatus Kaiserbacteria bacterium]
MTTEENDALGDSMPDLAELHAKIPRWTEQGVEAFKKEKAPFRPNQWNWMAESAQSSIVFVFALFGAIMFGLVGSTGTFWGRALLMACLETILILLGIRFCSAPRPSWKRITRAEAYRDGGTRIPQWDAFIGQDMARYPGWEYEMELLERTHDHWTGPCVIRAFQFSHLEVTERRIVAVLDENGEPVAAERYA